MQEDVVLFLDILKIIDSIFLCCIVHFFCFLLDSIILSSTLHQRLKQKMNKYLIFFQFLFFLKWRLLFCNVSTFFRLLNIFYIGLVFLLEWYNTFLMCFVKSIMSMVSTADILRQLEEPLLYSVAMVCFITYLLWTDVSSSVAMNKLLTPERFTQTH